MDNRTVNLSTNDRKVLIIPVELVRIREGTKRRVEGAEAYTVYRALEGGNLL
jgi:hypothetical protein